MKDPIVSKLDKSKPGELGYRERTCVATGAVEDITQVSTHRCAGDAAADTRGEHR